ncbi:hypothetical protein HDV06_001894 [Boothiomyces sp. JEL0866]|nr:hypothetical protein HDV06_001894 [Boothiomyces sp. JEL0866]
MPLRRQGDKDDTVLNQRRSSMFRRESKVNTDGGESDEVKVWKSLYFEAMLKLKNEQAKKQSPRDSQQFVDTNWLQGELAIAKSDKEQLEFQVAQLKSELLLLKTQMEDSMDEEKVLEPPARSRSGSETTHVNPTEDFYDAWLQSEFSPVDLDAPTPYSIKIEDLQRKAIERLETVSISKAPIIRSYDTFEAACLDLLVNILQWKTHPDLKPQKMIIKLDEDTLSVNYEDLQPEEYKIISQSLAFLPSFKKLEDNCLSMLLSVLYWKNQEIRQPLVKTIVMEGEISIVLNEKESELYQSLLTNISNEKIRQELLPPNYSELQEIVIDNIRQKKPSTETVVKEECTFNDIIVNILTSILQWKDQYDHKSIKLRMEIDKSGTFTVDYSDFPERALDVVRRNKNLKEWVNNPEEICLQVILEALKWKKLDYDTPFIQSVIIDGSKCIALSEREDSFYKMYLDRATRSSRSSNQSQASGDTEFDIRSKKSSSVDILKLQKKALQMLASSERSTASVQKANLQLEDKCLEVLFTLLQWKDRAHGECLQIAFTFANDTISAEYSTCSPNILDDILKNILISTEQTAIEDICLEAILEIIKWNDEYPEMKLQKTVILDGANAIMLNEREMQFLKFINENNLNSNTPAIDLSNMQEMAVDIIRQRKPTKKPLNIANCNIETLGLNILVSLLQWKDQNLQNQLLISICAENGILEITYSDLQSVESFGKIQAIREFVESLEEICLQLILQVVEWKHENGPFKKNVVIDGSKGLLLDEPALALYRSVSPDTTSIRIQNDKARKKPIYNQQLDSNQQVAILEKKLKDQKQKAKEERRALEDLLLKQFQKVRELEDDSDKE